MRLMILFGMFIVVLSTFISKYIIHKLLIDIKYKTLISYLFALIISIPAYNIFGLYALIYLSVIIFTIIIYVVMARIKPIKMIYSIGISLLCVLLMIGYGYYNMNHLVITHYQINTNKIDNKQLLVLSDLHMGNTMNSKQLIQKIDSINKNVNADYVFLVGDIVDERTSKSDMKKAFSILSQLNNKKGIYYVYGNHDDNQYSHTPHFNHEDIKREASNNHIHVLEDEVVNIDNISIIGRKDYSDKNRESIVNLVKHALGKYIILLDHQPVDMENNSKYVDIQISGHTHGGQIFPVGQIQSMINGTPRYGIKKIGKFTGITTSGIAGWGYPIKTGAPSEVVSIKIN